MAKILYNNKKFEGFYYFDSVDYKREGLSFVLVRVLLISSLLQVFTYNCPKWAGKIGKKSWYFISALFLY